MTTIRYTADGGHYRVGGYGFDPGDEKDVDDDLAEYLADRDDFEVTGDPEAATDETEGSDDNAEGPYRDRDAVNDGDCGFVDPETDGDPCGRDAGWGRDADDGPCKDHVDELEG